MSDPRRLKSQAIWQRRHVTSGARHRGHRLEKRLTSSSAVMTRVLQPSLVSIPRTSVSWSRASMHRSQGCRQQQPRPQDKTRTFS